MHQFIADFIKLRTECSFKELTEFLELKFNRKFSQSYISNLISDLVKWDIILKERVMRKNPNKQGGKTYDTYLLFHQDSPDIEIEVDDNEYEENNDGNTVYLDLTDFDNFKRIVERIVSLEGIEQEIKENELLRVKFFPRDKKKRHRRSNKTRQEASAREVLRLIREKLLDNFDDFYESDET